MSENDRLPYPGLRAYSRDETDLFFGREGCVNEMVDRLAACRFLAVLGASGSGKSSLVRTGLLDALELGLLAAGGTQWAIADTHPGSSAIGNLAAALLAAAGREDADSGAIETLDTFLRRGPLSVAEWVADGNLPDGHNLLLLVDQFEELFRYGDYAGREEAEAFGALLMESPRTSSRIYVVITMRSEYLGACSLIAGLAEQINSSLYLTRRMTREECREAIKGPAAVVGFDIEPALVSRMLNDLSALAPWESDREDSQMQRLSRQADQLPLMQHALSRLWQLARRREHTGRLLLTLRDYLDIGQLQGALDQHAVEVIARLDETCRPFVRLVFRSLVAGPDIADAVRKPQRISEIVSIISADGTIIREIVEAFRAQDCNFLRASESEMSDEVLVDISHESLIRQWTSLSTWFQDEARSSALWSRLVYSQERYAAGEGELQSGLDLANSLAWWERERPTDGWARSHGGNFPEVDEYLRKSRAVEEQHLRDERERARHEKRRWKLTIAGAVGFALICLLFAGYAVRSGMSARIAQRATQDANERSLAAADRFVVGVAERLETIPGIPFEEVRSWLAEGKEFLDELAEHAQDKRAVASIQAKFALIAATTLIDGGQFDDALKLATTAAEQLHATIGTGALVNREASELVDLDLVTARGFQDMGRYDEAVSEALQAVKLADAQQNPDSPMLLEQAKSHFQLSQSLAWSRKYEEAIKNAQECLDDIRRASKPESVDSKFYQGRCYIVISYSKWGLHRPSKEYEDYTRLAMDIFDAIPNDARSRQMLIAEATAVSNVAANYAQAGNNPAAREYNLKAEQLLNISTMELRQSPQLRQKLIEERNRIAQTYFDEKNSVDARDWYKKAVEVGLMDDQWRSYVPLAQAIDTSLADLSSAIDGLPWESDKDLVWEYEETNRKRRATLEFLIKGGHAADFCASCELLTMQQQFAALVKFDRVRQEPRYDQAMALADAVISAARLVLAKPPGVQNAVVARRAWFLTISALPDEPEDMPSIRTPAELILRLNASRSRAEVFLREFPGAWSVERKIGKIDAVLAKLFVGLGREQEAVDAAHAGAKMFNKASVELLAKWYRNGFGPIPRDVDKADAYDTTLANHNWSVKHFTIKSRYLWLDDDTFYGYDVSLEDARTPDDDTVGRVIWQLENLDGVKIKDDTKEALYRLSKSARENKASFVETVVSAIGNASSSDEVTSKLKKYILAKDTAAAVNVIARQWTLRGGPATVKAALASLFEENSGRDLIPVLNAMIKALEADRRYNAALALLDATLARSSLDHEEIVALYAQRAEVRDILGDEHGVEEDAAMTLALNPGDADALNRLGYLWVEQGRNMSAAVSLLLRAVKAAPNDPFIRDSLGWAFVRAGNSEKGLPFLESAARDKPEQPEILEHLGGTYRRLGRNADAAKALARATARADDVGLAISIQREQTLLGQKLVYGPSEAYAAVAAARLLMAADQNGRVGISTDAAGVAIAGYDPVAYFTRGEVEQGSVKFAAIWHDALWLFATAEDRSAFVAEPAKYAPAFGGFCAYCAAVGHKVHADPREWVIRDGKLYMHASESYKTSWSKQPEQYIADATDAWNGLEATKIDAAASSPASDDIAQALKLLR